GKPKEELVPLYLVDKLRFKVYGLQSDWYREKMDIVRFLEKKGINYWTTQIPYNTKIDIDRLSERNRWSETQKQEYLEKY
ncbi:MAG: hypothetical protein JJT78_05370, partial [Leptospira sp.]|nr:hypothetical protein [Leptospira sp.]